MLVVKTASPSASTSAPKGSPRKIRPSSSTSAPREARNSATIPHLPCDHGHANRTPQRHPEQRGVLALRRDGLRAYDPLSGRVEDGEVSHASRAEAPAREAEEPCRSGREPVDHRYERQPPSLDETQ